MQDAIRIFCLTTNTKNLLMWSHYADFHRGICIGFNKLYLFLNTGNGIGKINYFETLPIQKPAKSGVPDYLVQFLTKSDCWKYEEEFRMCTMDGTQVHQIEARGIEQVILGCKVAKKNTEQIIDIIKSDKELHHIKVLKAKIVKCQFELEFEELSID